MKHKERTKGFIMILKMKKPLVSMVYTKIFQRCKGYMGYPLELMSTVMLFLWFYSHFCNHFPEVKNVLNL